MISCSAFCTSGISRVRNVVRKTPISTMSLRLRWSEIAEKKKPPRHSIKVGKETSIRMSEPVRCKGPLARTTSEPVITKS